jgi:menaquinone-dependent protoporphyrinogen oxidase
MWSVRAGGTLCVDDGGGRAMDGLVLVAYGSRRGATREVAEAVCEVLQEAGVRAHLRPAGEVRDLDGYGAVVLGGSLYVGRWHRAAHAFLRRHATSLHERPLAVFALGPLPRRGERDWDESRRQLDSALAHHDVEPELVEVFGGRIDPARLPFPLSKLPPEDARDWAAIEAWARSLPAALRVRTPALL